MSPSSDRVRAARGIARWALAALLAVAGASHLTWGRRGYRIVVPDWATRLTTLDKDGIVVASGMIELLLAGRERPFWTYYARRQMWACSGFMDPRFGLRN